MQDVRRDSDVRFVMSDGGLPIRLPRLPQSCDRLRMSPPTVRPPFDQFLATAEAVSRERPEVDLEMAREVFHEAATMLDNSLALDDLDEHDASAVVAGLCIDLLAADPGAAIRVRAQQTLDTPGDVHDARDVAGAYLFAAAIFRL